MSRQDYVGEKIAVYFALLGHYTTWLAPLSAVGVIVSINQLWQWDLDAVLAPYFAVFVSFWAVSGPQPWPFVLDKFSIKATYLGAGMEEGRIV